MRICLILEGCYPYVTGGVSSWMQQYIQAMPQHKFVLWTIGANSKDVSPNFYVLGFFAGGICFYLIVWLRLEWYIRRLPYFLLSCQEVVPNLDRGLFVALCDKLDARQERLEAKRQKKLNERADRMRKKRRQALEQP